MHSVQQEDLCERIRQLKLTHDLLVSRKTPDEQDKKDAVRLMLILKMSAVLHN
jgi:hypothetical protein